MKPPWGQSHPEPPAGPAGSGPPVVPPPLSLSVRPSSPGSYFANHFIMGGEKFDSTHPEGYLFGENSDLNFLGNRPVLVGTGGIARVRVSVCSRGQSRPSALGRAEWILCCLIQRLAACHPPQGTGPCPLVGCPPVLTGSVGAPRGSVVGDISPRVPP